MDVNVEHGPNYGDVLIWEDNDRPAITLQRVHAQLDIDGAKLDQLLLKLLSAPTPNSHSPVPLPAPGQ